MEDILVVAPYSELADLAKKSQSNLQFSYSILLGNMEETLSTVKEKIEQGTKVVISRGGTAQYLKNHIDVPIIEIPVTSFDILHSLSTVSKSGYRKVAFITTSNIIFQADHFHKVLDLQIEFNPCAKVIEIAAKVEKLVKEDKVDAIIGDVTATQEALKHDVHGFLLQSGEQSFAIALQEAHRVLNASLKESARRKEMEAILNLTTEAVLTIDKEARVTVYNTSAEKVFGIVKKEVIGRKLSDCLPESKLDTILLNEKEEKDIMLEINDKKIICNRIPIIINNQFHGAVAVFQQISDIQNLELKIRTKLSEKGLIAKVTFDDIIGDSVQMKQTIQEAKKYAKSNGTVLIYGETGTGKEVFAQSIHNGGSQANGPFVSVNCASLSESLLESELFGYEEGAFTGAVKRGKMGLFELAHSGTIFLDEIGEISLNFQAKLLRVLQEKEIRRIGGQSVIPVNARIICATNRNLREEVKQKRFREDLYYRLNVLELKLDPLRDRKEDIIPMAISFLKKECIKERKILFWSSEDIFHCLKWYDWYGNARELQNFMERLVILSDEDKITETFIQCMVQEKLNDLPIINDTSIDEITIHYSKNFAEMEFQIWRSILHRYNGDKRTLCRDYGISNTTLWRKLNFKNEIKFQK
jgi:PAS domain S-box-containing protein